MAKDLYVSALLDVYGACLSDRQQEWLRHYYDEDLSLGEIAEIEGITRQGVRDAMKRAEQQLYFLEERCGYCKTFLRLKELAASDDPSVLPEMRSLIDSL